MSLQRKPSRLEYLDTSGQRLDIRAHQRTYQGAYVRTCLGCLTFSLLVMRLFSKEFMPIGMVYQVYALFICGVSYLRSKNTDIYFINFNDRDWYKNYDVDAAGSDSDDRYYFKTSGNYVLLLFSVSLICYGILIVMLARV